MPAKPNLPAWSTVLILAAGLCLPAVQAAAQNATPQDAASSGGQAAPRSQRVQFRNGQLSIVAQNSTLGEILSAVRAETGARLDFSRPGAEERVTVRLGPGPPRDVLAALLNGSRYNYILLGTPANPAGVAQMILTDRGSAPPSPPMPQPPPPPVAHLPEPEEENQEGEIAPEPPTEVPAETTPPAAPAAQPPQVKTPQQLLQELQERLKLQQEQREGSSENPERE